MPVHQLGRVACSIRRNRILTQGVELFIGKPAHDDPKAESRKYFVPQGCQFEHSKRHRQPDGSASPGVFLSAQRSQSVPLVAIQVWNAVFQFRAQRTIQRQERPLFALVSRNVPVSESECVDRERAPVRAAFTCDGRRRVNEALKGMRIENRRRFRAGIAGIKRCTERTHEAGDRRPGHLASQLALERSEDRIVEKRSALYDDVLSEFFGRVNAKHFVQRVFDDALRQTGRNVLDSGTVLLRLLHR